MNPTPSQIAAIQSFVGAHGGWSQSTDAILSEIRSTTVANPVGTAPQVPAPYTIAGLLGQLGSPSLAALKSYPGLQQLGVSVANQESAMVLNAFVGLAGLGFITGDEASALAATVNATQADPSWTADVTWDFGTLGRPADAFDVETARHAPGGQ